MATREQTPRTTRAPKPAAGNSFAEAFPSSTKVYLEGPHGVRVPVREIALSGGEPPLQVYDPSGPQGFDVRQGLPSLRRPWIMGRGVDELPPSSRSMSELIPESLRRPVLRGRSTVTQLRYARAGEITLRRSNG